ncbi:hypothetical protein N8I74_11010 [Chitiniphilus purpureus]|uniref:Mor transcription activator domain-containing protein n=1 Tax=Chitiniphilus purpureus TaxID=2981137 RepID=A0ABY6DL39_9NEIS|nr:Mor transcription activator family protein [Chitiniphilus sp. CD1]UXY13851.1 hypothetical protein N8I74_11010 [Chitiniphilus sp. CD1]
MDWSVRNDPPDCTPPHETDYHALQLHHELTQILRDEAGYSAQAAQTLAAALVRGMRKRIGGQEFYVPAVDKRERDAAIRREFNGLNRKEICRKFGISKSRLYAIVGRQKP